MDRSLLRRARCGPIEVEPRELLFGQVVLAHSMLHDTVPDWLSEDMACEGLKLYLVRQGRWVLAPLDD